MAWYSTFINIINLTLKIYKRFGLHKLDVLYNSLWKKTITTKQGTHKGS
jgi:hypothetical protein